MSKIDIINIPGVALIATKHSQWDINPYIPIKLDKTVRDIHVIKDLFLNFILIDYIIMSYFLKNHTQPDRKTEQCL